MVKQAFCDKCMDWIPRKFLWCHDIKIIQENEQTE